MLRKFAPKGIKVGIIEKFSNIIPYQSFLKTEKNMRVEMQRFIVTFSPTLLLFFGIKRLSHIFKYFLYINNKNGQQCFPKIVAYSSLAYIFCIFSKVRDLCVRIRQTGHGRNFFSNLGLNV